MLDAARIDRIHIVQQRMVDRGVADVEEVQPGAASGHILLQVAAQPLCREHPGQVIQERASQGIGSRSYEFVGEPAVLLAGHVQLGRPLVAYCLEVER